MVAQRDFQGRGRRVGAGGGGGGDASRPGPSLYKVVGSTNPLHVRVHLGCVTETHLLSVQPSHRNAYCS